MIETTENIFFEGGSIKGTAYVGALRELQQHADLSQVRRFGGTSAGAIGATFNALGFTVDEQEAILMTLNYNDFLDGPSQDFVLKAKDTPTKTGLFGASVSHSAGASSAFSNLGRTFGMCPGEYFRKWLERKITCKVTGMSEEDYGEIEDESNAHYLTFGMLHDLAQKPDSPYKDLYVIAANVTTGESEVLSWESESSRNVIISDAVRCSMSIPVVFFPHKLYERTRGGARGEPARDDVFVDGGLSNNYRAGLWDRARYVEHFEPDAAAAAADPEQVVYNPRTLGFRLCPSEKKAYYEGTGHKPTQTFRQFIPFLMAMGQLMHNDQNVRFMAEGDVRRTIIIDTLDVKTLDFDLPDDKKHALIASGARAVREFCTDENVTDEAESAAAGPASAAAAAGAPGPGGM